MRQFPALMKLLSSLVTLTLRSRSALWKLDSYLHPSWGWFIFICTPFLQKSGLWGCSFITHNWSDLQRDIRAPSAAPNFLFWLKSTRPMCFTCLCSLVDYLLHPGQPSQLQINWMALGETRKLAILEAVRERDVRRRERGGYPANLLNWKSVLFPSASFPPSIPVFSFNGAMISINWHKFEHFFFL